MSRETFQFLSQTDWAALWSKAARHRYAPGETIVEEGASLRRLYIVNRGYVGIERQHQGHSVTLALLGPGAVFGEMSFLEHSVTTAFVVAHDEVEVDVIDGSHVQALLASDSGFSARFYQCLAVTLADRLRETSDLLSQYAVHAVQRLVRFHKPRAGYLSERQIPESLATTVGMARSTLLGVEEGLKRRQISPLHAQQQVDAACNSIVDALGQHTTGDALTEMGFADLLSFRDADDMETGVGAYLFREMFPFFISSVTMARLYAKPTGFAEDFETTEMFYRDDPEGDGSLGPLIDRWFLSSKIVCSRRRACRAMTELLSSLAQKSSRSAPAAVTCLASGSAKELIDVVGASSGPCLRATCVDLDADALASEDMRAAAMGCQGAFTFLQEDIIRLARGQVRFALAPQQMIYTLATLEYLEDQDVLTILNWAHQHLEVGGRFAATCLAPGNSLSAVMEHLLEWTVLERTPDELGDLFVQSRFAGQPLEIEDVGEGVEYLAVATRR